MRSRVRSMTRVVDRSSDGQAGETPGLLETVTNVQSFFALATSFPSTLAQELSGRYSAAASW
jgi:hypothetical protein